MRLKSEQYFDAIQGMIDRFAMKKDLEVVYVTSTIPSQSIINALEVLEIPMDHIWFVDCVSQIMMSQAKRHPPRDHRREPDDAREHHAEGRVPHPRASRAERPRRPR